MCADPRLREQIYAEWRAERAARRRGREVVVSGDAADAADVHAPSAAARLLRPAIAAPVAALVVLVFLTL